MLTLFTKNSSRTGNAIIYDVEDKGDRYVFLVETDFGNKLKVVREELDELWFIGKFQDYNTWLQDRDTLREQGKMPVIEVQTEEPRLVQRLTKKQWKLLQRVFEEKVSCPVRGHEHRTIVSLIGRELVHPIPTNNLYTLTEQGKQLLQTRA